MQIKISDHFTYRKLFHFIISPIIMMVCISLYSIIDGFFVSNFVNKTAFAAINLVIPITNAIGTIGFLIGTGGSAIISKTLGEKKNTLANQYFSMLIYFAIIMSLIFSFIGFFFIKKISILLGATGDLLNYCVIYGKILFISMTAFILQNIFQTFLITAEKPKLSLKNTIFAGLTNIIFDYIFIVIFKLGIFGAALATALGQMVGGLLPFFYFLHKNNSLLQLKKPIFYGKILLKTLTNGSSEMITNLSLSTVSILYNLKLMKLAGENGIAAYGIIMYVNFIFTAIFIGFSIGTAPIFGYNFGAANQKELKNLFKKSTLIILITDFVLTIIAEVLSKPLINIFAGYDIELFNMTCYGFRIYSISFLFMGINIWSSSFFTALNNGVVSALISFLRTFIFQIFAIIILPILFGINGIWLSIVVSELLTLFITIFLLIKNNKRYSYF